MISAVVIGGAGYTGGELVRLLLAHPQVELRRAVSRSQAGKAIGEVLPHLSGCTDAVFSGDSGDLNGVDVAFFATPNGVAMTQAEQVLAAGARVIDLAADFRLADAAQWEQWYEVPHACPGLLADAVYGLPECYREQIKGAHLVANPGCYPTSVILGFKPVLEAGLADTGCLVADSKSGVSGAGRTVDPALLYAECGENFKAYKASAHRHWPEIKNHLQRLAGGDLDFSFTPHLLPAIRGIHSSLHFKTGASADDLQSCFDSAYADEPFVKVLPRGSHPEMRFVRGTNHCLIAVHKQCDSHLAKVLVVIDNLVKGAAGQAVQNMNLMFSLDETTGLTTAAALP